MSLRKIQNRGAQTARSIEKLCSSGAIKCDENRAAGVTTAKTTAKITAKTTAKTKTKTTARPTTTSSSSITEPLSVLFASVIKH